ncbi:prosaposin-like [Haliotis rufescens]|uniref:prosaposin-like n=1 Tax=Haliotis rufescens TaxID=6454 RepID=UPI00201EEF2A|nr:prosaposin-like [Haliotis rufescens]
MNIFFAITVLAFVSQANGQAGRVLSVQGSDDKVCTDCINFFTDVAKMVSSANTTAEIEQLLDQMVCSSLGSLEDLCKQVLHSYVPQVLQYLANQDNPNQICGLLGMCTQEVLERAHAAQKPVSSAFECDLCKQVVTKLRAMDRDQTTQTELKQFVEDNICPYLGTAQKQCVQDVETYAAILFQLLANELDPTVVCEYLKLCTQAKIVPMTRIGLTSHQTKVKVMETHKNIKVSVECTICEFALTEVDQILGNNRSQAAVEAALDKVCDLLPSTISQECVNFVNTYGAAVIKLLIQNLKPDEICKSIGLCAQGVKSVKPKVGADVGCIICEFVMTTVDSLITANSSQAEVEAALEKVCTLLPATISAECSQFVQEYGPAVINLLVNKLDPKSVCKTLRLCTSSKVAEVSKSPSMKPKTKASAGHECVICEFIMRELDIILGNNRTQAAVEAALDKVCDLLPSTIQQECTDIVNTYGPAIIQLLVQELDADEVCQALRFCTRNSNKKAPLKVNNEVCDLCVTVMNYADELLKENATVQDVEMVLDKVCNFLSAQMTNQCLAFVDQYAPLVLDLLASDLDPKQICQTISLCPASRGIHTKLHFQSKLLGKEKCSFGPSFWCANKDNAMKCNAMEHCQKHVWN